MEKQKNIPELRFSEFNGEWEQKKLGEDIIDEYLAETVRIQMNSDFK